MTTRSTVAVQTQEGILSIYVHYDGYPERMLPILNNFFNTHFDTMNLIKQGSGSFLAENGIENTYKEEYQIHKNIEAWKNFRKEQWCEYGYLFDNETKSWTHNIL